MAHFLVSIIIPLASFVIGLLCRKLIRGHGWEWKDFYCGAELSIVAVTSSLVQIADLGLPYISAAVPTTTQPATLPQVPGKIMMDLFVTGVFAVISLTVMLFVMSLHQDNETDKIGVPIPANKRQKTLLGLLGNFVGLFLFFSFLLWVKRP